MGLFARKPEAAPTPAPAKRSRKRGLRSGELSAAIVEVCGNMAADCSARETLEQILHLPFTADDDLVRLNGSVPFTIAEFDEALAQAPAPESGFSAATSATLRRFRELVALVETQKAKEPIQYLTLAQAKALEVSLHDDKVAQAVWDLQVDKASREPHGSSPATRVNRIVSYGAASGLTGGELAALKRLADRVDAVSRVLGAAERRRAGGRLNVVPGAGGRNF